MIEAKGWEEAGLLGKCGPEEGPVYDHVCRVDHASLQEMAHLVVAALVAQHGYNLCRLLTMVLEKRLGKLDLPQ